MDATLTAPELANTMLKDVGEGYCILTQEGLLPQILWVGWAEEAGDIYEIELEDESYLLGPGAILVTSIWHEDADSVTAVELAAAPPRDTLGNYFPAPNNS